MLAQERQAIILEMFQQHHVIKISDIAAQFGISNLTARRDVGALEEQNLVRRVYGGAVLVTNAAQDAPVAPDEKKAAHPVWSEKRAIGKQAASMIQEGDIVFLGTGSTVLEVAKHMRHLSNVTVLTNSLAVINALSDTSNTIYILGGLLDKNEHHTQGTFASSMLETFCADKAFIGCGGVSLDLGVTDYSNPVADIDRIMVKNASQSILVCNSHKFGSRALSIVCPLASLSTIITDEGISVKYRDGIAKAGVDLCLIQLVENALPDAD